MLKYVLLLLLHTVCIRGDCDYSEFFSYSQGYQLVPFLNLHLLPNIQTTLIPVGESISLYCEPEFEWDFTRKGGVGNGERSEVIGSTLTISCNNGGSMGFVMQNGAVLTKGDFFPENSIKCKSNVSFYGAKLEYCDHDGMWLGGHIKNISIVAFELCYDIIKSEPIFMHYVAAQRSKILEKQIEYNPSKVTKNNFSSEARLNLKDEIPPQVAVDNNYTLFSLPSKHLLSGIEYQYYQLDFDFLKYSLLDINNYKKKFHVINSVPWWTALRIGNWKVFENLLSRQLDKGHTYTIYAGKSHKASFPKNFVCSWELETITYAVDGMKKHIPLFIWNYIIPQNEDNDTEEFVLIAINSPFFDSTDNNSLVICEDICDRISWLKPFREIRKASSFGYIFCCKPENVFNILDGFPVGSKFNKSNDITTSLAQFE